ncbi:MAG: SPFH domain-containing protein [Tepidisphaeraceae bacterium]
MIPFILILVGVAMCGFGLSYPQHHLLDPIAGLTVAVVGAFVVLVTAALTAYMKLYRKSAANMAYVRTGQGGARVILDKGMMVIPVVHQLIPVSLETMRLNVERRGPHALITKDNLRVDLSAEFYIKVQANDEDIIQAARSLGSKNSDAEGVSELVQEKLVMRLRTVAATKDLVELHSKRDEFASSVQEIVIHDLKHNGLTLESVTISALDQTDPAQLQERNVFDAQGLRKIAEITQKAKVERNHIEQLSMEQIVAKNVETKKKVLDMERAQAEFEAEQRAKVATVQAQRQREVAEFKLAQDEAVARRDIEKNKAVETAEVERQLAVEAAGVAKQVALVAKHKEQETANIDKLRAVEVANRLKEIAIAEKEQERAAAQALVLGAEADREKAKQSVTTVQIEAEAAREASKKLIAAQQAINEKKLRDQTEAEVAAFMAVKKAEAEKQAAELLYQAKLRLAEAEAASAARKAEGDKALKTVDVDVERERVKVEQARVEVERQSLANKSEFEEAALKFELEKLRIEAEKEFRIKSAEAMASMMSKVQMQIFGDPTTMAKMSEQFMRAASLGTAMDGLSRTMPDDVKLAAGRVLENLAGKGDGTNGN